MSALILIPNTLGDDAPIEDVVSSYVIAQVKPLKYFVVENAKNARALLKKYAVENTMQDIVLFELDKHINYNTELNKFLSTHSKANNIGVISDAGCPAIADPGSDVVRIAHGLGMLIMPMVGPSSILLALMASGFNGQSFAFNGYLPIDNIQRIKQIKFLENLIHKQNQTQIFIETPYRNNKLLDELANNLQANTYLCVAVDLTLPTQFISTKKISDWKNSKVDLHKRPCIFLLYK